MISRGRGAYALALARRFNGQGTIYAADLWKEGIDGLRKEAAAAGFTNIRLSKHIPVQDRSIIPALKVYRRYHAFFRPDTARRRKSIMKKRTMHTPLPIKA